MIKTTTLTLLAALFTCSALAADENPDVRVMSFNIRFGSAKDGDNHWDKRHPLVVEAIKNYDPDLLGTQETLKFQAEYLQDKLTHMTYVGWSRDANDQGEQCGILFRTNRFTLNDSGQFWLSDEPETKFSKSWDSSLPRVATWVNLTDNKTNAKLLFLNTHFDHRGVQARLESAKLIRKFVESQPEGLPIVVTGDFNCGDDSEPYQHLLQSSRLVDTFRNVHPEKSAGEGTFGGFKRLTDGARIDWVLVSGDWNVSDAAIDRFAKDGKNPSDHYPVTATMTGKYQSQ